MHSEQGFWAHLADRWKSANRVSNEIRIHTLLYVIYVCSVEVRVSVV